ARASPDASRGKPWPTAYGQPTTETGFSPRLTVAGMAAVGLLPGVEPAAESPHRALLRLSHPLVRPLANRQGRSQWPTTPARSPATDPPAGSLACSRDQRATRSSRD